MSKIIPMTNKSLWDLYSPDLSNLMAPHAPSALHGKAALVTCSMPSELCKC